METIHPPPVHKRGYISEKPRSLKKIHALRKAGLFSSKVEAKQTSVFLDLLDIQTENDTEQVSQRYH